MTREPTRVLLVADGDALAAKLEAMLRDDPRLRVRVGSLRALARLVEDHDPALVILASSAARAAAALGTVVDVPHVPPVVLLVEDVRAAWTAGMRRAGVRAVLERDATVEEISAAITAATGRLVETDACPGRSTEWRRGWAVFGFRSSFLGLRRSLKFLLRERG